MENRYDLMDKKKEELLQFIESTMPNNSSLLEIADALYECSCIHITPPQEPPVIIHMVTMDSLKNYKKGSSIKPGNIMVNIKNLIDSLPEIVVSVVGIAVDIPILKVCAVLNLWKMLRKAVSVEIDKTHAIVILALWKNRNGENKISPEHGFECSKKLYAEYNKDELSYEKYSEVLNQFVKIGSIEWVEGNIWLREWIRHTYI